MLVRGLDLSLAPGHSLLVVGPSGCGKSSILRAAAGLWSRGAGAISAPAPGETFFLPQKPYMPLGTLRQQLLFPSGGTPQLLAPGGGARAGRKKGAGGDGDLGAGAGAGLLVSDPERERLLKVVRLPDLADRWVGAWQGGGGRRGRVRVSDPLQV